jgi:hypothetical protein
MNINYTIYERCCDCGGTNISYWINRSINLADGRVTTNAVLYCYDCDGEIGNLNYHQQQEIAEYANCDITEYINDADIQPDLMCCCCGRLMAAANIHHDFVIPNCSNHTTQWADANDLIIYCNNCGNETNRFISAWDNRWDLISCYNYHLKAA